MFRCTVASPYSVLVYCQMLGEYLEATKDYETVLECDPVESVKIVSLVGLAQTLIASAQKDYEQFFHARVKNACTRAIAALMK